ncbi:hypothetical protein BHU72_07055 [Desulfuribacillus stibiiarsenatis]|uniref:Response regulatory domain-containing protein n=1 Tax=Desulfuribacillus stibiiarsenatis TaxID=1390249 RepID=A0A1E5L4F9_9FIRM|nr:response regulator [Desulfuribacillus stibiiarsenatis]OEH84943.1 hypothetical protein BHU72_07055 [Desulfuribacillus stibiiarsenatis]
MGEVQAANILIVDDKKINRIILEKHLKTAQYYNISHAGDGQEALDMVKKQKPDLILLDIVMPGIDGFEVCQRLKSDPRTQMVPIVMVTALNDHESKLKCIEFGANDILNKPVDSTELIARVKSLIHVKQYYDQLHRLNEQLIDNLKTAATIQRALLPKKLPQIQGVSLDAFYRPTEIIGGDSYNIFPIDEENLCFYIADVSGHQLDAAMLTVFIKEFVSGYTRQAIEKKEIFKPVSCLQQLDEAFKKEEFPLDIFITMFLAVYHCPSSTLTYSTAGFAQVPLIYGKNRIRHLHCSGKLIMALEAESDFEEHATKLEKGEGIFIYTDGLVEQLNPEQTEHFGTSRIEMALASMENGQEMRAVPMMIQELSAFAGTDSFQDDIAIITMFLHDDFSNCEVTNR